MKDDLSKKRVFMLCGHAYSGKTTLCENILSITKAISSPGKVEEGNTSSDYHQDEIERKSSINASFFTLNYKDNLVQFVDTPGYVDFIGEMVSAAAGVDFAVMVIDATEGTGVGTEKAWEIIKKRNIPCLFFINKLDGENADYQKAFKEIKNTLSKQAVPLVYPAGKSANINNIVNILDKKKIDSLESEDKNKALALYSEIVESVAESNDTLLEKYLDKGELDYSELLPALKKAVAQGNIYPVAGGVSISGLGIDELLDIILNIMPATCDRAPIKAKNDNDEEIEIQIQADKPFSGQVIKTSFDPYLGQLSVFRAKTGKLESNTNFYNSTRSSKEKGSQLYHLQGKEQKGRDFIYAGEIGSVTKLKNTHTGDTLCGDKNKVIFADIQFPEATFAASVKPKTRQDEEKIAQALHKLAIEDPTFKVSRDAQTKELIISGIGELHMKVIIERIKRIYGVEIELGKPKVPYKETITKSAKVQGRFKKQTGGHGQYGDVWIEVEPLERGNDFEFVNKIVGGKIPRGYIPSVEKGVRSKMKEGFLAGFPISDIRVILYDGSYHPVDSSDWAFQIAGAMALKNALAQANPVLLEPIMNAEISVDEGFMGQITGDLSSRRGKVMGMDTRGKKEVIKAQVPLEEMYTYASDLKSVTGGRGSYAMSFSHYEIVPKRIAQAIVEKTKQAAEAKK